MLRFCGISCVFLAIQFTILAQETGKDTVMMNEILVESNRLKMTKAFAPNKIQVFEESMIQSLNGSRLTDALELGDAMFIKDYGFNSGTKTLSLNSTQSEHTLILINGVRLNSRQNALVDISLFDLDNVSKIEVSKGGSSALYGSEAIGGVINILTQNNNLLEPVRLQIKAGLGSYGYKRFFGKFSHMARLNKNNTLNYYLSYSDERAMNDFDYYFSGGTSKVLSTRQNSDYNTQAINLNLNITDSNNTCYELFTIYSHFDRGVPGVDLGYSPGTARQIDYISISSFSFSKRLNRTLSFRTGINYKYSLQKYFDTTTYNLSVVINSFYKLNSYVNTSSINYDPSENIGIESGYEVSYNNIASNETEKGNLFQGALFTAGKYAIKTKMISKVTFYPSVRYDYFSNIDQKHVVTGKLGLNIKPFTKTEFNIKSSLGNNFSAPTFNELYWNGVGNKDLKPERSVCFDAGFYYKFNLFLMNEIEFSYYNINTTDRIVWMPASGSIWRPFNVGKVRSEGIDISLSTTISTVKNVNAGFRIDYSHGSALKMNEDFPGDPSFGKQLIYLPKETLKSSFMMNYLPTSKFVKFVSFSIFYRFTTRRFTDFENLQFSPRFDILDANAGIGFILFKSELGLKFIINNILNENYQVVSSYPMPLRNYKFEISFKY